MFNHVDNFPLYIRLEDLVSCYILYIWCAQKKLVWLHNYYYDTSNVLIYDSYIIPITHIILAEVNHKRKNHDMFTWQNI
jgi:hypothetical protein